MTTQQLIERVRELAHIESVNPMQTAVAASEAPRLQLIAPTGSGKTLAIALAILKRIRHISAPQSPSAIIIAPSRELVRQIAGVIRPLALPLKTLAVYGGNPYSVEKASVDGAVPNILVATPGRLLDHINRKSIDVDKTQFLVIDEYDKILELGFSDEMKRIATKVSAGLRNKRPQFTMLTSATAQNDIPTYLDMDQPEVIDFTDDSTVGDPRQRMRIINVPSPDKDKLATLTALLRSLRKGPVIVFVNHRESAERLSRELARQGIINILYHGGLDQRQRQLALEAFELGGANVLVSTDLAGRGIDIDNVKAVIHYHPAISAEIWTHRNGRTARIDRNGEIYVISSEGEDRPEWVSFDSEYYPEHEQTATLDKAPWTVLYLDLGKRDKVSRADIAGFLFKQAGLESSQAGKIKLSQDYSLAAVAPEAAAKVFEAARSARLKGKKVRVSKAVQGRV